MKAKLKKSGKVKITLENQAEINLFAALLGGVCGRVEDQFKNGKLTDNKSVSNF